MSVGSEIAAPAPVRSCAICSRTYEAPRRVYCSDACARRAYYLAHERGRPEWMAANRARNAAWARASGRVRSGNPWLLGPPAYGPYLPGAGCEIAISPAPRWPVLHRNVRALHGVLSHLLGEPHGHLDPAFAVVPWSSHLGWGVWFWGDLWQRFACRRFEVHLFNQDCLIRFGGAHRVKAPAVRRGRRRVRIDAITPVCVRNHNNHANERLSYTAPTEGNLRSTLCLLLPRRLGVQVDEGSVLLDLVERRTQAETVRMGGKQGVERGFVGHLIVEANAPARWLLACAERVGLGGRTAFGFGRIRVTEVGRAP